MMKVTVGHITTVLAVCGILITSPCIAQTASDIWDVPRTGGETITEPSPEATAMRRYQDYPVSFATGTADISIPLISLSSRDLEISLGISYHTGGIKKSDIATGVGLGWTLTGLGSVSRQINGFPDEWRGADNSVKFDFRTTSGVTVDYLRSIIEAKTDTQYDCYNYNCGGYSGSFYIVNGKVVEYPQSELDISYYEDINEIAYFKIVTPDGKIYTFEEKEYIEAKSYSTRISFPLISRDFVGVSQWNLTKIESLATKDSITITYKPRQEWSRISDKMLSGHSFSYELGFDKFTASETPSLGLEYDEHTIFRNHSLPSVITTGNGIIEFSSRSFATAPYVYNAPADYLASIRLKDLSGNTIKEVSINNSETFLDKRQKLAGIDILTDGILTDRYKFGYNDLTSAPGEDFFGYPNGKGLDFGFNYSALGQDLKLSSSRLSDYTYLADNCLTEINSITGLNTSIAYEPALISVSPRFPESVFSGDVTVGLRIKCIEVTDKVTGRNRKRSYSYQGAVSSIPLGVLKFSDFISQSGVHTFYNSGNAFQLSNYSIGVTFPSSATVKGASVENARLYYSKVTESLTGTGIDHAILTEYEYCLDDVSSTLMRVGCTFPENESEFGNNPESAKRLNAFHNFIEGMTEEERRMKEFYPSCGYMTQTFGSGPLLKRRSEKEWTATGYRTSSTEELYYSKTDHKRFTNAIYCESAVFRYIVANGPGSTLNITDYNDMNYFCSEITSYRTVCDSTIKTTYYPGGESRRVKTDYINSVNSAKGGRFPGFYADSVRAHSGVSFTPLGVIISCGAESIATFTAQTENVYTERNFNITMAGMRKLPALEKWVTRTPVGSDSVLRQTDYSFFGTGRLVRPDRVIVTTAESLAAYRSIISEQKYTAYDNHGRITAMTDAQGRNITAQWAADYDLLTKMTLSAAGLSTAYSHRPLIGCTSITSPSGKKRQFAYSGGRLTSEKNTAGTSISAYTLYGEDSGGNGRNLITSTIYDNSGSASETTVYDGFGMPVGRLSPIAGDSHIYSVCSYDALDRLIRQYLPVSSSGIDDVTDVMAYYNDANPYRAIRYRAMATDLPLTVLAEGQLMQAHPESTEYLCNNTKDAMLRCPRYLLGNSADSETVTLTGDYPAGMLDVTRTTDPDGHIALTFTDWRGLTIMQRKVISSSSFADTYYLYDPLGRRRVIIQPEGTAVMTGTGNSWNNSSKPLSKNAFIFRYDSRGNCRYTLVPGAGGEWVIYDALNRPAFLATAAMNDDGQVEYYLYDRIGRPVVIGLADITISNITALYNTTATYSPMADGIDQTGYIVSDQELSALLSGSKVTTANYYDNYSVVTRSGFSSLPNDAITQNNALGLLTAQRLAIYSYGNGTLNINYQYRLTGYDREERETAVLTSSVIGNEYSLLTKEYTRQGYVSGETSRVVFTDNTVGLKLVRSYDPLGNLLGASASMSEALGDYGRYNQSRIDYEYDALGRASKLTLFSLAPAFCSYSYDMRGRLNCISSPGFTQRLYYEDGANPVYNGGISAMQYGYDIDASTGLAWLTDKVTYRYDALGRLVTSISSDGYRAAYGYDLNSAPTTILRSGLRSDGVTIGLIDDLKIQYDGNRPVKVSDRADRVILESSLDFDSPDGRSNYKYDASGRLIADSGSEIDFIKYAPNDRPLLLETPAVAISYRYRADGAKLGTMVRHKGEVIASAKIRYDLGPFRFLKSNGSQLLLERVNLPWGYIDQRGVPNVYIKDHQGNVRAVYNQLSGGITQQTDYYPYGLPKAKSTNAEANPFKYVGKELTTDFSNPFYDFEARVQLPTLGLFNRPDPKAIDSPWLNTFSYCGADPVNYIDLNGKEIRCLSKDTGLNLHAKRYDDNGNIILFMHGFFSYMLNEYSNPMTKIKSGKILKYELDSQFDSIDPNSSSHLFIELHSCHTGENDENGSTPLAQRFSEEIPNAIIKAPNGILCYGDHGNEVVASKVDMKDNKILNYDVAKVQWRYFYNGIEISPEAANFSQILINLKLDFLIPYTIKLIQPYKYVENDDEQ